MSAGSPQTNPDPVRIACLTNGLRVLLKEIHTAPIISHWVWYRVGSRDEHPGRTGLSHWVEHMQFKGTPAFPASALDKAISRDGGMWNAFTYFDWTTYFETMPADKIDLALRLEADRMTHCLYEQREVEAERTVILSEREGHENEPLFRLGEAVQQACFDRHPYRHEVIGEMADLRAIQRDDLYNHYRAYYHPANAILAVAGDFETDEMLGRIEASYGDIPAGSAPQRPACPEPFPSAERRLEVAGPGETAYLELAYRAPAGSHPDFFPLTVLDSLLSGPSNPNMFGGGGISNKTSRLYRALVEKELAVALGAGLSPTIDPYLYGLTLTLHPRSSAADALQAVDDEVQRIQEHVPTDEEVARASKQARAMFAYGAENITNQAFWLGYPEMYDTHDWFTNYLDRLAEVTPAAVQQAARDYLRPDYRVVGTYRPEGGEPA